MSLCDAGRTEGDSILELVAEHGFWPPLEATNDCFTDANREESGPAVVQLWSGP